MLFVSNILSAIFFFVKCGGILLLFSLHFNQICASKAGLRRLHCILEIARRFLSL